MAPRKNNLFLAAALVVLSLALLSSHNAIVIATTEGECKTSDINIFQEDDGMYPNRIPMFRVHISNTCINPRCTVSEVHLCCGWFASVGVINPKKFRRLSYNDCLVNNGDPLTPGDVITFSYGNTFKYPLTVVASANITC